jgi:flagellar basal body-associated protein FliL
VGDAAIVGIVIGVLLLVGLLGALCWVGKRKHKAMHKKATDMEAQAGEQHQVSATFR